MIHELPEAGRFLDEMRHAIGPNRLLLVAEPKGHVKEADFAALMETARRIGFQVAAGPEIRSSWTAILRRG